MDTERVTNDAGARQGTVDGPKVHPYAASFPMMSDDELDELAADIKASGLRDPIVYDKDRQLVDGRNRLEACRRAGVEPSSMMLPDGVDPVAYILSKNVERRHLNGSQRAMAVARSVLFRRETASSLAQTDAAQAAGVSKPQVSKALTVLEASADLADEVMSGTVSVQAAYEQVLFQRQAAREDADFLAELHRTHPDWAEQIVEGALTVKQARDRLSLGFGQLWETLPGWYERHGIPPEVAAEVEEARKLINRAQLSMTVAVLALRDELAGSEHPITVHDYCCRLCGMSEEAYYEDIQPRLDNPGEAANIPAAEREAWLHNCSMEMHAELKRTMSASEWQAFRQRALDEALESYTKVLAPRGIPFRSAKNGLDTLYSPAELAAIEATVQGR